MMTNEADEDDHAYQVCCSRWRNPNPPLCLVTCITLVKFRRKKAERQKELTIHGEGFVVIGPGGFKVLAGFVKLSQNDPATKALNIESQSKGLKHVHDIRIFETSVDCHAVKLEGLAATAQGETF